VTYNTTQVDHHYILLESVRSSILGVAHTEEEADSKLVTLAREDFDKTIEQIKKAPPKPKEIATHTQTVFIDETR